MIRLTKYTIQLISGLLLALLTAGCVADRNVSDCITEGEDVELEFALQVPALETSLRQLSADEEKQIKSIQVLVFNTQDEQGTTLVEDQETFAYEAKVTNTNLTPDIDGVTHLVCKLKATDKPMRIVCIANHNVPESILVEGTAKKTILEDTQMKKVFDENGWKTDGTQLIPMWGESDAQPVNKGTRFNSCAKLAYGNKGQNRNNEGVIHLVRALARVDVGVNFAEDPSSETATGSTDFKIKSVRVYRYATSMFVAGTQATSFNFASGRRNAIPHTPEDVKAAVDANPLVFTAQTEEDAKGYVRNIYIPEISNHLDNGQNKGKNERTCLVVGGSYKGGKETYYRVDFIRRETKSPNDIITEQLDILRNYRYRFNITKIAGPGTDTPEEALTTEPVNISCDVVVWDEADIDKIMYDGQYYLSVSKDKFSFGKDATSESYTIRTNWPKGYEIVDKDGHKWATTKDEATTKNTWAYFTEPAGQTFKEDKDMTSTVNVLENTTNAVRTITTGLYVKAGRIKWPLQITQSDKIELDVKVYPYESDNWRTDCSKMPIDAYTCVVNTPQKFWVKFTEKAKLGRIPLDRDEQFKWKRINYDEENGIALFEVEVKAEDISEEDFWTSEISKFRTVKGDSKAETDFTLRVMKWDAIPYKDPGFKYNMLKKEPVYTLAPYNRQFYIRANAPYTLTVNKIEIEKLDEKAKESEVVKGWYDGKLIDDKTQPAYLNGEAVPFRSYDYLTGTDKGLGGRIIAAHVTLTLAPKAKSGEEGYFETKTFKIHFVAGIMQPEANTYVVEAGQVPILIPCSQINKAHDWMAQYKDEITRMMKSRMESGTGGQHLTKTQYENYVQLQGEWGELATLNPDETEWTAKPVWSTLHPTGDEHGLKDVHPVHINLAGKNYIFVQPKPEYEGCALISAIKDNKIIWNWTIWVVKKIADGGHGYPWDDGDNGTQGAPYMNRNLGAYRMASEGTRTIYYDKYINDMAGLYYRHGTPIPHHAYDVGQGPQNDTKAAKGSTHCTKPWYDTSIVKANKQTNLPNNTYTPLDYVPSLQSINDLIQNPDKFAYKDKLAENILEFGSNEISAALGKASWQGGDGQTVLNNEYNFRNFKYKTQKTPFDPSPYGWKVPAAGMESVRMAESPNLAFSKTGAFISGNANGFASKTTGDGVILHCATCYSNSDMRLISFYVFSRDRWFFTNTAGAFGTGDVKNHPSGNYNVRCIENEEESDYRDYTQDAVLSNAFRATKAARSYHR